MFCRNCGKELLAGARFCSGCGTPVEAAEVRKEAPAPQAAELPREAPAQEAAPVQETVPTQETSPTQEAAPTQETVPTQETSPTQETAPAQEAAPTQETAVQASSSTAVAPITPAAPAVTPPPAQEGPILTGKKYGKGLLLAGIGGVVVLVVVLALLIPALLGGGKKNAYVYLTDDSELMFRKDLKVKTQAVELDDEALSSVRITKDGKFLYFFTGDDNESTGDLYRVETAKIGKKGGEPEKVASDVYRWYLTALDNGGALYLKGSLEDMQLRYFDGKESSRLARSGSYYTVDERQTYVYYTEIDDTDYTETLYRVELKKDGQKEKLLSGAAEIYSGYDADTLVYGKSTDDGLQVYSVQPGGEQTKLLKDAAFVFGVESSGSKVSFSYLTDQGEKGSLYDLVTDRLAAQDASAQRPSYDDYKISTGIYSWNYTIDRDGYNAAYQAWQEAQERQSIRETLKSWEWTHTSYTLMRYDGGEETKLAEELTSYPAFSVEDGIYLYTKDEDGPRTVADVADLEYAGQVYDLIGTGGGDWYQNVGGVESSLDLDAGYGADICVLGGTEAVVTAYQEMGETVLWSYTVTKTGLTDPKEITDEDISGLATGKTKGGKDALYFYTDMDSEWTCGDFVCYQGGNKTTLAREAAEVDILEDGTAFKLDDMATDRKGVQTCTLSLLDGKGSGTKIADDVAAYTITYLGPKSVVYITGGDLCVWNGSASEKIADDVTFFWAGGAEQPDSYLCGYGEREKRCWRN